MPKFNKNGQLRKRWKTHFLVALSEANRDMLLRWAEAIGKPGDLEFAIQAAFIRGVDSVNLEHDEDEEMEKRVQPISVEAVEQLASEDYRLSEIEPRVYHTGLVMKWEDPFDDE